MKHCSHCGRELKPEQQYGFPKVYCLKCWLEGYGQTSEAEKQLQAKQAKLWGYTALPLPMDELWNDENVTPQ